MKKLFTLLSIITVLGAKAQSSSLLYFWGFNAATGATAAQVFTPDFAISSTSPSLNYTGTAGVTAGFVTTDTINQQVAPAGGTINYVKILTPYAPFIWTLPTTGYKNIVVTYAVFASGKGSKTNTITYSLDGGKTWDSTGMVMTHVDNGTSPGTTTLTSVGTYNLTNITGTPMDEIVLDFSNVAGANNNPLFQVQTTYVETGGGNDRYHNLSVNGTPGTLPLLLQSFNGAIVNKNAKLAWATSNEVDAKSFSIEASADRKNFSEIGSVDAKNVKGTNGYAFETAAPTATTYYRLKMINKNGSFTYSSIVALNGNVAIKKLTAFPNPAVNSITISHELAIAGALIKILSVDGKAVLATAVKIGAIQTSIDVSKFAKGSYIVSFENNGAKTITQFVK
ncbi:MAG: T9SS type A sorting domain-containing protein [Alphaproteobacteria bacterium]